jgi:DNA primase
MSVSYKDLKGKKYLEPTKSFLESHLGIRFTHNSIAHCPFHDDTHPSFGIYLDDESEIRFHCLANCQPHSHWDIYDLIMYKEHCTFRQAQQRFAKFLGIKDFEFYRGRIHAYYDEPSGDSEEKEEPILEAEAEELTDRHKQALLEAADFYNRLLMDRKDRFERAWKYLSKRGLDEGVVEKFKIGFCPALEDQEYRGRALLNSHLQDFMKDVPYFQIFNRLSLFLLLNQPDSPMYQYYGKHID